MSDKHKRFWKSLQTPPPSALKQIKGGRLKGMTDINPQWRLQAMTATFGPCGIGWKYTIDKLWTEAGSDSEVLAFAQVSVLICVDGQWSEPIPGIGGNQLVAAERNGLHSNDEAYKMAVTDALSVAFKALGVAADVYEGLWDGSKFQMRPEDVVTLAQLNLLKQKFAKVNSASLKGKDRPEKLQAFREWCLDLFGEEVDYTEPSSWNREWHDAAWKSLQDSDNAPSFE